MLTLTDLAAQVVANILITKHQLSLDLYEKVQKYMPQNRQISIFGEYRTWPNGHHSGWCWLWNDDGSLRELKYYAPKI